MKGEHMLKIKNTKGGLWVKIYIMLKRDGILMLLNQFCSTQLLLHTKQNKNVKP
jgi:hypothetical protein